MLNPMNLKIAKKIDHKRYYKRPSECDLRTDCVKEEVMNKSLGGAERTMGNLKRTVKIVNKSSGRRDMARTFFLVVICSLITVSRAQQYFIEEPNDVTANLGDESVIFKCIVGSQDGTMQWLKDGFGLGTDPSLPGFPRYTLTSQGFLSIGPVTEADVGLYQCQVGAGDNSRPIRSRQAQLTVQLPPGQPKILGADNGVISVTEGSTGFLECVVDGAKPAATIDWAAGDGSELRLDSKNSRTIKDEDTLTFKTVSSVRFHVDSSMQNKTIVCTAENIASREPVATSVQLSVMYKPRVKLGISTGAGVIREGDSVAVHCAIDANPPPYGITWRKNGVVMSRPDVGGSEHLNLDGIDSSYNNAVVECEARNSLGSAMASTTIKLLYAPRIITHPKSIAKKEGDLVTLTCLANSNPPPRYVWYNLANPDEPIGFTDSLELVVSRHTVGRYQCQAIVDEFPTVSSKVATVTRLEAPKISKKLGEGPVQGELGKDVEILCPVDTMVVDRLNITWYYKGRVLVEGGKYLMGRSEHDGGVDGILRIRDATLIDFGEYGCRVDNEIGSDYTSIVLEPVANGVLQMLIDYLPYICSAVGGVVLVLLILLIVYCCRARKRGKSQHSPARSRNKLDSLEDGYLNDDRSRPIIKNLGPESYRGSYFLDKMDTASLESQAENFARQINRPMQNVPPTVAGFYGNPMLNSRIEEDRMSSSSSQSQYPLLGGHESWGRPPLTAIGGGRRRSQSPYTTNSEMVDYSANSTMSSEMSKGSRSSRSHGESAQSSGEETPLMNRRDLRLAAPGPLPANSRYYVGGGGSYSDGEDMGRSRKGGSGYVSGSDGEEGRGGGGGNRSSGYYSDGGASRSGWGRSRMRRVSEEHHDADDDTGRDEDELETLSE